MATNYNPQIITNGLSLYLDAGNIKNYNLTEVEVLVVAGGGGGGSFNGGGGGAGGLIYNRNFAVTPGSALTVTVGAGGIGDGRPGNGATGASGAVGTNGGNSVFGSLTAIGGGVGATYSVRTNGVSGGSGGGSWGSLNFAGGTAGQGNAGGGGYPIGNFYTETAGGGGGAGSNGVDGGTSSNQPGAGGLGLLSNISGTAQFYAAGGGAGANRLGGSALGGSGIGGNGGTVGSLSGQPGAPNTGSGGGGAAYNGFPGSSADGGAGGSGIVIVRYPGPQKAIGGTVTSVNGDTIHTFTTVGSTTFTPLVATNNSAILGLSDFSGRGNFGTTVNSPTYSSANGGSIVFDGTDDYVTTGFTRGTLGNYLTLTAWYKYTGTAGRTYSAIIGGKEASTEFFIGKNDGNTNIGVQDGNYYSDFVTGSNAFDGNWHQIVYSYDNGTGKIYLDGTLRNTNSFTKCNDAEEIIIGGETGGSGYYFNGNISLVSFYNRVLAAQEIQQNFTATRARFGI